MMPVMEILISLAAQYQTELAAVGQTPEILAEGSALLDSLRQADQAQELKKDTKRSATWERYQKFQVIAALAPLQAPDLPRPRLLHFRKMPARLHVGLEALY